MFCSWAPTIAAIPSYARDERATASAAPAAYSWIAAAFAPNTASTAPAACCASDAASTAAVPRAAIAATATVAPVTAACPTRLAESSYLAAAFAASSNPRAASRPSETIDTLRIAVRPATGSPLVRLFLEYVDQGRDRRVVLIA